MKPTLSNLKVIILILTILLCEIVHSTIFLSNKAFKFEQRKHLWKCSSVALWTRMTVERWYSIA